jgi:hypothetical protein
MMNFAVQSTLLHVRASLLWGYPMISKPEAADALRDVDRVHHQTVIGTCYSQASRHLLFWGVIWSIGYIATGLTRPDQWPAVWVAAAGGGLIVGGLWLRKA